MAKEYLDATVVFSIIELKRTIKEMHDRNWKTISIQFTHHPAGEKGLAFLAVFSKPDFSDMDKTQRWTDQEGL